MLSKKTIERLAALAKIAVGDIEAAIKDEAEKDLTIDEKLVTLTETELTSRDDNSRKEGEKVGEEKGKEIATKVIRTKLGIDSTSKDPEKIAELAQARLEGDTALKDQVALLQKDIKTKDKEIEQLQSKVAAVSTDTEIISYLPTNRLSSLETSEHLNIVKNNLEFTTEGVKYKGEILRDPTTRNVLDKKAAVEFFYRERKGLLQEEKTNPGGRGGSDSRTDGAGVKSLTELWRSFKKSNPSVSDPMDESFQDHVIKALKENPEMDMSEIRTEESV